MLLQMRRSLTAILRALRRCRPEGPQQISIRCAIGFERPPATYDHRILGIADQSIEDIFEDIPRCFEYRSSLE